MRGLRDTAPLRFCSRSALGPASAVGIENTALIGSRRQRLDLTASAAAVWVCDAACIYELGRCAAAMKIDDATRVRSGRRAAAVRVKDASRVRPDSSQGTPELMEEISRTHYVARRSPSQGSGKGYGNKDDRQHTSEIAAGHADSSRARPLQIGRRWPRGHLPKIHGAPNRGN